MRVQNNIESYWNQEFLYKQWICICLKDLVREVCYQTEETFVIYIINVVVFYKVCMYANDFL